jgi:chromate transport protein ChrA
VKAAFALALLALGVVAQFAWRIAPEHLQDAAWTVGQAALIVALLGIVAVRYGNAVRVVCALLACWQAMTIGCTAAWMARPWQRQEGEALCSDLLNLPLGAMSGCVALILAWRLYSRGRDG